MTPANEAVITDEKRDRIIAELEKRIRSAKRKKSDESYFIETTESDIESFKIFPVNRQICIACI